MMIKLTMLDGSQCYLDAESVGALVPAVDKDSKSPVPLLGVCVLIPKIPALPAQVVRESMDELARRVNFATLPRLDKPGVLG